MYLMHRFFFLLTPHPPHTHTIYATPPPTHTHTYIPTHPYLPSLHPPIITIHSHPHLLTNLPTHTHPPTHPHKHLHLPTHRQRYSHTSRKPREQEDGLAAHLSQVSEDSQTSLQHLLRLHFARNSTRHHLAKQQRCRRLKPRHQVYAAHSNVTHNSASAPRSPEGSSSLVTDHPSWCWQK